MIYKKVGFLVLLLITNLSLLTANSDEDDPICIICQNNLFDKTSDVIILPCSGKDQRHEFHFQCINNWQQKKSECPYCRNPLISGTNERLYNHIISPNTDQPKDLTKSLQKCTSDLISLLKIGCCGCFEED